MMDNGLLSYEDTTREENTVYNYRVTGVNGKGEQSVSDMGNANSVFIPINMFVDAEGNYDGGFEQEALLEGHADTMSDIANTSGWYERLTYGNDVGVILNDPEMARTGDHCFYLNLFEGALCNHVVFHFVRFVQDSKVDVAALFVLCSVA